MAVTNDVKNNVAPQKEVMEESYEIRLYSLVGQLVKTARSLEGELTVDVSDLPDGMYIMHVIQKGKVVDTKKIVVQKSVVAY
jgi:hypothetical protein